MSDPKLTPTQRRATGVWLNGTPGLVQSRKARTTGTVVGVYDSLAQGIESDPDLPWSIVCEVHHSVVSHHALRDALTYSSHPEDWCDDCRGVLRARANAVMTSPMMARRMSVMDAPSRPTTALEFKRAMVMESLALFSALGVFMRVNGHSVATPATGHSVIDGHKNDQEV